jgi:hypothetical protein
MLETNVKWLVSTSSAVYTVTRGLPLIGVVRYESQGKADDTELRVSNP